MMRHATRSLLWLLFLSAALTAAEAKRPATQPAVRLKTLFLSAALAAAEAKRLATQPAVRFKTLKTPMLLDSRDSMLRENKFVATLRVVASGGLPSQRAPTDPRRPEARRPIRRTWVDRALKLLVKNTPKEHLPSLSIRLLLSNPQMGVVTLRLGDPPPASGLVHGARKVRYDNPGQHRVGEHLTYDWSGRGFRGIKSEDDGTLPIYEFKMFAPTPEQAKELALALITAYKYGWAEPERREWLGRKEQAEGKLSRYQAKLKEARPQWQGLDAQLKQLADVGPEALAALKAEEWLVAVKLAGAKARLSAIREMKLARQTPTQLEQQLRIAASIELAGLLARKAKISELVATGNKRKALVAQEKSARKALDGAESRVRSYRKRIKDYDKIISLVGDLMVLDNTITIQPIRAKHQEDAPPGGPGGA